jgi:hypothetical protein
VFLVTNDASETMRRRARDLGAAGIFDKTTELEALTTTLATMRSATESSDFQHPESGGAK